MGEITCSSLLAKYLLSTSKAILSARQANYQICLIWKRQNTFKLPARLRIKRQVPSLRRKMLVRGIVSPLPWSIGMCRYAVMPHWFCQDTLCCLNQLSHAITPPLCSKKGGGHKNACVDKTLRCVSQRKLARKQNTGISTRKLALWPRKWCVSGGVSNSLRPSEMKDLFSTAQLPRL